MKNRFLLSVVTLSFFSGCIQLHNVQVGDVVGQGKKITVEVSDLGVDMDQSIKLAGRMANRDKDAGNLSALISLFQYGPRTGNVIYRPEKWTNFGPSILEQCPKGTVTGLVSTREFRDFNFVSTETARITGYCTGE
jgi:hypothetical protein